MHPEATAMPPPVDTPPDREPAENPDWLFLKETIATLSSTRRYQLETMLTRMLKDHRTMWGETCCGLLTAPAGSYNHHTETGGLLRHLREMTQFHHLLRTTSALKYKWDPNFMTEDRIITGICIHDLHKAHAYFLAEKGEDGHYVYSPYAKLWMTENQKTQALIATHGLDLDMWERNALEHSEGGWAENPPKGTTVLAKYLYLLDELSGNVLDRMSRGVLLMGDRGRPLTYPVEPTAV